MKIKQSIMIIIIIIIMNSVHTKIKLTKFAAAENIIIINVTRKKERKKCKSLNEIRVTL